MYTFIILINNEYEKIIKQLGSINSGDFELRNSIYNMLRF